MRNPADGYNYFTDNGAVYCFHHLGASARYTGRDISGQKIETISAALYAEIQKENGDLGPRFGACETCGAVPIR